MSGHNKPSKTKHRRRTTQNDSASQLLTGATSTSPVIGQYPIGHGQRFTEDPEQYDTYESNMSYGQRGDLAAKQPLRSESAPAAGQLVLQNGGSPHMLDSAQLEAMVAARVAQIVAQGQAYAQPNVNPFTAYNTAPPQPARQGHRYNGALNIDGRPSVLMGNLVDSNQPFDNTAVHEYNFATTLAPNNNARLVMGDSTADAWYQPNQGQATYTNGVYTSQQGGPPQGPYQQNRYRGR